jgi:hypothetical protein
MSSFILFLDSRARISGSRELFMKEGSRVELECGVEDVPGPPAYIYWYRHDQVLSYQAGHQLTIATSSASNNSLISKLSIKVHYKNKNKNLFYLLHTIHG